MMRAKRPPRGPLKKPQPTRAKTPSRTSPAIGPRDRLTIDETVEHLSRIQAAQRKTVLALRNVVFKTAPGVCEAIRFHSLCYFKPGQTFGAIGGNVCMIEADRRGVRLSFIQGTAIPDPHGLLTGTAKAKRFIPIRSAADARRLEIRALIRAADRRAETRRPETPTKIVRVSRSPS